LSRIAIYRNKRMLARPLTALLPGALAAALLLPGHGSAATTGYREIWNPPEAKALRPRAGGAHGGSLRPGQHGSVASGTVSRPARPQPAARHVDVHAPGPEHARDARARPAGALRTWMEDARERDSQASQATGQVNDVIARRSIRQRQYAEHPVRDARSGGPRCMRRNAINGSSSRTTRR
jgi:hypothetical protein